MEHLEDIGRRVQVKFDDGLWYGGVVTRHDADGGVHIDFDDGDQDVIELEAVHFVEPPASAQQHDEELVVADDGADLNVSVLSLAVSEPDVQQSVDQLDEQSAPGSLSLTSSVTHEYSYSMGFESFDNENNKDVAQSQPVLQPVTGTDAIGRRIEVLFELDDGADEWYAGCITAYDAARGYHIEFDDGDKEWEDLSSAANESQPRFRFVQDSESRPSSGPEAESSSTAAASRATRAPQSLLSASTPLPSPSPSPSRRPTASVFKKPRGLLDLSSSSVGVGENAGQKTAEVQSAPASRSFGDCGGPSSSSGSSPARPPPPPPALRHNRDIPAPTGAANTAANTNDVADDEAADTNADTNAN